MRIAKVSVLERVETTQRAAKRKLSDAGEGQQPSQTKKRVNSDHSERLSPAAAPENVQH